VTPPHDRVTAEQVQALGDELYACLRERRTIAPLTGRIDGLDIDAAYAISRRTLAHRIEDGERLVGKKIGVTSKVVQDKLGVHQPDFGFLTDAMHIENGGVMPASTGLIQPRAEAEIAFVLKADLVGPGVTRDDVLAATAEVRPCFEIVDSRIDDWKIAICDTVADNASSGMFVLGGPPAKPADIDLETVGAVVFKNGELLSTGAGAATLGHPLDAMAWLANTLSAYDIPLLAGEVILSGALVPLEPVGPGDELLLRLGGVGEAAVSFS
jgi:2-oxopent-4-enoate/cis-2-oxohex-4-enoate hydratase